MLKRSLSTLASLEYTSVIICDRAQYELQAMTLADNPPDLIRMDPNMPEMESV